MLGILQDRQSVLPAQGVGGLPHGAVIPAGAVELFPVGKGHGVDDKMGMEVVFPVQVGGNQHLVPASPQLPGQLYADLMGQLRGALSRGEGLVPMVGYDPPFFAEALFHRSHLPACGGRVTVDTGDKLLYGHPLLPNGGFPLLDRVADQMGQIPLLLEAGVLGLFRVGGVVQNPAQVPPHRPQ